MDNAPFHDRLLAIVLRLPGAYEDRPWGSVHCKVAEKIFIGWGQDEDGHTSMGFKTDKDLQAMLVASDPRFTIAKYVGKHGWVDMKLGPKPNWAEVEQFIVESYRWIAPRTLVKQLDAGAAAPNTETAKPAGKAGAAKPTKKAAAAKPTRTAATARPARKAATRRSTKKPAARS
ncbi:MAG: MmcQ/YjbR family DNA-binding protein [Polyangiaceae bacterium]